MALTKDQKKAQVAELVTKLQKAESVMFSHYIGLTVSDVQDLRRKLREQDAEMKVAKKTLMKLAFKEAGMPDVEPHDLDGAVACIFSFGDPLTGAQVAFKFGKDHDHVELVGGLFDGKLLSKEEALELAKMPSRNQLLATFASMLQSPTTTFAGLCNGPLSGFARAMSALADKGGVSGDAGEEAAAEEKSAEEAPAEEPKEEAKAEDTKESDTQEGSADAEKPSDA